MNAVFQNQWILTVLHAHLFAFVMLGLCIMARLICANVLVVIDISVLSLTYQHREVPCLA